MKNDLKVSQKGGLESLKKIFDDSGRIRDNSYYLLGVLAFLTAFVIGIGIYLLTIA